MLMGARVSLSKTRNVSPVAGYVALPKHMMLKEIHPRACSLCHFQGFMQHMQCAITLGSLFSFCGYASWGRAVPGCPEAFRRFHCTQHQLLHSGNIMMHPGGYKSPQTFHDHVDNTRDIPWLNMTGLGHLDHELGAAWM